MNKRGFLFSQDKDVDKYAGNFTSFLTDRLLTINVGKTNSLSELSVTHFNINTFSMEMRPTQMTHCGSFGELIKNDVNSFFKNTNGFSGTKESKTINVKQSHSYSKFDSINSKCNVRNISKREKSNNLLFNSYVHNTNEKQLTVENINNSLDISICDINALCDITSNVDQENESADEACETNSDDENWNNGDNRYTDSLISVNKFDPVPVVSSFILDSWDSGIEEELKSLPKLSNSSQEFILHSDSNDEEEMDVFNYESDNITKANTKWSLFYESMDNTCKSKSSIKKVHFPGNRVIETVYVLENDEECRKGPWEQFGRDEARFRRRIEECEKILAPIFEKNHRNKNNFLKTFYELGYS